MSVAAYPAASSRVVIHCTLGSLLDVITKLLAVPPPHWPAPYVRSGQSVHVLPSPRGSDYITGLRRESRAMKPERGQPPRDVRKQRHLWGPHWSTAPPRTKRQARDLFMLNGHSRFNSFIDWGLFNLHHAPPPRECTWCVRGSAWPTREWYDLAIRKLPAMSHSVRLHADP